MADERQNLPPMRKLGVDQPVSQPASPTTVAQKLGAKLQRHWLVVMCGAFLAAALLVGAPVWAAPPARPLNQTVPRPTPTDPGDPLATATPRAGDDDDGDDDDSGAGGGGDTGGNQSSDPNAGIPGMPGQEGDAGTGVDEGAVGAPGGTGGNALTAATTVDGLNLREGPSTDFNVLGNLPANATVTVLSRNEDGSWWYICCLPGTQTSGWVSAQLLTPNFAREDANSLLAVFGTAQPTPVPRNTPQASQVEPAGEPLALDFKLDPPFVWQGITATLTITVANPNPVDIADVELSDELPETLTLLDADADAGGEVEQVPSGGTNPLLLFRWPVIPAETSVTATLVISLSEELLNGVVIDNLVAVQASNAAYSTGGVTIGLPPLLPPTFE